jgi:hypothetical protein
MAEIDDLRRELAALRSDLTALRDTLATVRHHTEPTMRRRLRCPACGCARIAHAMTILDRGADHIFDRLSLHPTNVRWWGAGGAAGELEAYACTGCGLLEWYVKEPAKLADDGDYLRIIDGGSPDDQGPYR